MMRRFKRAKMLGILLVLVFCYLLISTEYKIYKSAGVGQEKNKFLQELLILDTPQTSAKQNHHTPKLSNGMCFFVKIKVE